MPDREFVDAGYQEQKKVLIDKNYDTDMKPMCLIDNKPSKALYIDAEGDFYPCCWMGTYRYQFKSVFSPKNKRFNIATNSIDTILNNDEIKKFFDSTNQFTSAHECCKIQCGVKNG